MTRRRYPLVRRCESNPGIVSLLGTALSCDRPELQVDVFTRYSDPVSLRFVFDTGDSLMVIPIYVAQHHGIPYSLSHPGNLISPGGPVPCYYDFVRVQSSLSGRIHRWPCAFADNPRAPLLIGRAGFLDEFGIAIRSNQVTVTYPGPLRRAVPQVLARVYTRLTTWGLVQGQWQSI